MSESLPERPHLGQLRRRAKELRDAARHAEPTALELFDRYHPAVKHDEVTLAAAQLVIARELGFPSWPRLKMALVLRESIQRDVSAFLSASVDGRLRQASDILSTSPDIAASDLRAASVLGASATVREMLRTEPEGALAIDEERGWPPLLYACYSRWHQIDIDRVSGLAEVVRILLDAGSSPNTNDGGRLPYRSALKGSVEVNNPGITEVLLQAGANPDAGEPIAEAVGHRDHRCLQLLLDHGARVERTWAIGAAVFNDDVIALTLLLHALETRGIEVKAKATETLCDAVLNASLRVVAALLDAGADANVTDERGVSVLRLAIRTGKDETAARFRDAGAVDDSTEIDRFLGACRSADRQTAMQLSAENPDLRDGLSDEDLALIVDAAATGPPEAVALMLDLGFAADALRFGEQPLHAAAYQGNADIVRLLLDRGADVNARDERFDGTPLAFATVGSGEQAGKAGDWIETVRLLTDAGASRKDAWVSGKPPSEDVMELLRSYGIGPEEQTGERSDDDEPERPGSIATGVVADVAEHLETAHRELDLDLFGSLLHPDVRWTGECTTKEQVLDWYRGLLAEGTVVTVTSIEVDRDAVVLGLAVGRQAEGARPAPPRQLYQAFTVSEGQVVEIRGYSDRPSALARS